MGERKLVRRKEKSWLKRDYKTFMKKKEGKKIIKICRILARGPCTAKDIRQMLEKEGEKCSKSEIYKLLEMAQSQKWIRGCQGLKPVRGPGKPLKGESKKRDDRPPILYSLAPLGFLYMRGDSELSNHWDAVEAIYEKDHTPNILDSFASLYYAIRTHPTLGKLQKSRYFDNDLYLTILKPLLFDSSLKEEQFDELSDELTVLIAKNVRPEFIKEYRKSLQRNISRLKEIIKRHRILVDKIKSLEAQLSTRV